MLPASTVTDRDGPQGLRVLLFDRGESTRLEIHRLLLEGGCAASAWAAWEEARERLRRHPVDAVVLCDWRRLGGRGAHRYLKPAAQGVPFVAVCDGGLTRWDDRFSAVLVYPVTGRELIRALKTAVAEERESLSLGAYVLDLKARSLSRGGARLGVTGVEAAILKVLMAAQGEFVASDDLVRSAWGIDSRGDRRILYTHVAWLRRKMQATFGSRRLIASARGLGYRFVPDP